MADSSKVLAGFNTSPFGNQNCICALVLRNQWMEDFSTRRRQVINKKPWVTVTPNILNKLRYPSVNAMALPKFGYRCQTVATMSHCPKRIDDALADKAADASDCNQESQADARRDWLNDAPTAPRCQWYLDAIKRQASRPCIDCSPDQTRLQQNRKMIPCKPHHRGFASNGDRTMRPPSNGAGRKTACPGDNGGWIHSAALASWLHRG